MWCLTSLCCCCHFPCTVGQIQGVSLPADAAHSLSLSDGFHLRWSIRMRDEILPIGNLHINALSQWRRMQVQKLKVCGAHYSSSEEMSGAVSEDEDAPDEPEKLSLRLQPAPPSSYPRLFDLDCTCPAGHVCLLYTSPISSSIYFVDLSSTAYFLAPTLTHYYRLLLMHIGIPHWQYAFTDAGMNQSAEQWFNLLSPHRLEIDLKHERVQRMAAERAAATAASSAPPAAVRSTTSLHRAHSLSAVRLLNGSAAVPLIASLDLTKVESMVQSILLLTPKPKRTRQQQPASTFSNREKRVEAEEDEESEEEGDGA
jgi:hypothetical protein